MAEPEWVDAATKELSRLGNPHRQKKRATVLALVDARLAGLSEETVWRRQDTCSRKTYHEKWKHDPTFSEVLDHVHQAAEVWTDGRAVRALSEAAEKLALASPDAVDKVIDRMNRSIDEAIVLRAAFGILDRADVATGVKSSSESSGSLAITGEQFNLLRRDAERQADDDRKRAETEWDQTPPTE